MKGEEIKRILQRVDIPVFVGLPNTIDKDNIPERMQQFSVNNDNVVGYRRNTIYQLSLQWT